MTPEELYESWERQQEVYIEHRQARTTCLLDLLSARHGGDDAPLRVLDVGCGPGSLSRAVLDRFPHASVVGVDRDPLLLRLFAETHGRPGRVSLVDADLRDPTWPEAIDGGPFDAAVSATALHWLEPDALWGVHAGVAALLRPGGSLLNADHLLFDAHTHPVLHELALADRERAEEAAAGAAHDWAGWWDMALALPGWENEAAQHRQRWSDKSETTKVGLDLHLASMRAAGFVETACVWRWLDDTVVFGRLGAPSATATP